MVRPLGEQIFLIRKHDERTYWYAGGDPVTPKKIQSSRAYFYFSVRSHLNTQIVWDSFKNAYSSEKTKKVMCTIMEGEDPRKIGFSDPDDLDNQRVSYFNNITSTINAKQHNSLAINIDFDRRFLCKLGLAVAYGVLGESYLASEYSKELRNGVWYRPTTNCTETEDNSPQINATSTLGNKDEKISKILSTKGAVIIVIIEVNKSLSMQLMIGDRQFGCIKIADLPAEKVDNTVDYKLGMVFILYKFLKNSINIPLPDYLAHRLGNQINNELSQIESYIKNNEGYFKNLR